MLKDDAVKVLHSICQQIWKAQQWIQDWKRSFLFQSQGRAMPQNIQTTAQLHSFHTLARLSSKSFKLSFHSTWTEKFQMYKLVIEKAEVSEIKLPPSVRSYKKEKNSRKTSTSASLIMQKSLTVWITTNCGKILKEMGTPDHLTCLLRNLCAGQEIIVRTWYRTMHRFKIGKG